jgi:hypothetical protein
MRRALQFLQPARDFLCDFLVIFDERVLGVAGRESCENVSSVNGDSCCMLHSTFVEVCYGVKY